MRTETGSEAVDSTLTRGYGTLGGLALIGAALFTVPSTLLIEPLPPAEAYLSTLAGVATGLVCLALPWERLDRRWLHVFGVLATVEAAWAVAVFGEVYAALFFLVAVSVAYVTPDARSLLPHLGLIGLALVGPTVYGPTEPRDALQMALVVFPLLALTAGIFAYLRQRMVADNRSYRRFAEETLSLADRIAGRSLSAPRPNPAGDFDQLPAWSKYHVSARASALAAGIFATPLVFAGLAVAGVKLPPFAAQAFGDVGIDLPNQAHDRATIEPVTAHDGETRRSAQPTDEERPGAETLGRDPLPQAVPARRPEAGGSGRRSCRSRHHGERRGFVCIGRLR